MIEDAPTNPTHLSGRTFMFLSTFDCSLKNFRNFAFRLPRCGSVAQRSLSLRHAGIYYIFEKAYIYALFLATRNFEHSKQSLKDRVTIDATGMYIPIRAHFRHLLEMGLGYLHITAWSRSCSFWRLKQVRRLRVAGRVMIRLPLFFCPNQSNCAMSESMAVKASDPKCNSLTT